MRIFRLFWLLAAVATLLIGISIVSAAQFEHSRYTSPPAHSESAIAGHKITIDYYAPSMHGRKIFGALVPYNQVWCTGANWATKITSDADLQMGALKIPKGSHSIWTIPADKQWTLIINNETGQFHLNYDGSQDLGRTKMNIKPLDTAVETFKIDIRANGGNSGTLALDWEKTEAYMPFTVGQ
ncbi:MAG TPA: DUF2911 domain-containing protein [Candidatus Acidoferrum sp.]|jgi:hypothetical protein|nr:DUF2911 domain-containing protein [Candidatus Acidoferrum sp.]